MAPALRSKNTPLVEHVYADSFTLTHLDTSTPRR